MPHTRGCLRHPVRCWSRQDRAANALHGKYPYFDLLSGFRPRRSHFARAHGRKLPDAHAHPGSNHSPRIGRPRRRRHRPDRHRQDRRFRAADPPSHPGQPHQTAAQELPRAGAQPDARTVRADSRQLQCLRPAPSPHLGTGDRRRSDGTPGPLGDAGRRGPRRHARPPARPRAKQRAETRPGRIPRARRGRPHAGHGLHQRHPENRRQAAGPGGRRCSSRRRCRRISPSWPKRCCATPRA